MRAVIFIDGAYSSMLSTASVNNWPLLWYQVRWLKANGVTDIAIYDGMRYSRIDSFFGDGEREGVRITKIPPANCQASDSPDAEFNNYWIIRGELEKLPPSEDILIAISGNVLTTQRLDQIIQTHRGNGRYQFDITLMAVRPYSSAYGQVFFHAPLMEGMSPNHPSFSFISNVTPMERNKVKDFTIGGFLQQWVDGGVYVINRELYQSFSDSGDFRTLLLPQFARMGLLGAHRSSSFWTNPSSFKEIDDLSLAFSKWPPEDWPNVNQDKLL